MPPKKAAAKPAAATKPAIQDPTKVRKSTSTTEKPKKAAATKAEKTSATKAPTVNGTLKKRPATAMAAASEQADEVMADAEAAPEAEKPKKGKAAATKKAAATGTAKTNGEAPKKAPAAKAARSKTPTPAPEPAPTKTGKRKLPTPAVEEETAAKDERAPAERPTKRAKTAATAAAAKKPVAAKTVKAAKVINEVPTQVLDVYVFGEGSSGELGLGSHRVNGKKPIDVKRPRLNENLSPARTGGGVVQIATGGMHAAVLTKDNRILTWGVNDQGALGRDTSWEGGLRDIDASEDSDAEDEDTGLNPRESTPAAVDPACFPEGTRFVQLAASDNATFALTDTGLVWGWGTFRGSEGVLGFTEKTKIQPRPQLIEGLKDVKQLAAGSNHVLALTTKGEVLAWGAGQQSQLARRIIERNKLTSLQPQGVGLPKNKIEKVACGAYHSFAIAKDGSVYAWGLNNFAETGVPDDAGSDEAVVLRPTKVDALSEFKIVDIAGGVHHSLAATDDGKLVTWGRVDGGQVGVDMSILNEDNAIYDDHKRPRILIKPAVIPGVSAVMVAAGTDNSFAIDKDGRAWSWGFSANYQTGQGTTDDIMTPTVIDNTAVRGKRLVFAGAGGQYSILAGIHEELPNGTAH